MRILTDIRKYNPDVKFLLENVEMGDKWERILSEAIGVFGVHINSALVSAQNRKRIYWTNIRVKQVGLFGELHSDIPQPKDEGILIKAKKSAVLHDWLYTTKPFSREECDKAFLCAMEAEGLNWVTRQAMYRGVRLGGALHY